MTSFEKLIPLDDEAIQYKMVKEKGKSEISESFVLFPKYFDTLYKRLEAFEYIKELVGNYAIGGHSSLPNPGLVVNDVGPITLPFLPSQALSLIAKGTKAPFGRGEKTIFDDNVRKTWQIEPSKFQITNPDFEPKFDSFVQKVSGDLGKDENVKAELYKCLIYEPGDKFLPHRDSEKAKGMFATLVLILPSSYEGGELVVECGKEQKTFDFAQDNRFEICYEAFYCDCVHEIKPITSGYRLCLVYNLISIDDHIPKPAVDFISETQVDGIAHLLSVMCRSDGPGEVILMLEHMYTQESLSFRGLKNVDLVWSQVLQKACEKVGGVKLLVALVTVTDFGKEGEQYERNMRIKHAVDLENNVVLSDFINRRKKKDYHYPIIPLHDLDETYDRQSCEQTGNEGVNVKRWYKRAVIICVCEDNSRILHLGQVVTAFEEFVEESLKKQQTDSERSAMINHLCHFLDHFKFRWNGGANDTKVRIIDGIRKLNDSSLLNKALSLMILGCELPSKNEYRSIIVASRFQLLSYLRLGRKQIEHFTEKLLNETLNKELFEHDKRRDISGLTDFLKMISLKHGSIMKQTVKKLMKHCANSAKFALAKKFCDFIKEINDATGEFEKLSQEEVNNIKRVFLMNLNDPYCSMGLYRLLVFLKLGVEDSTPTPEIQDNHLVTEVAKLMATESHGKKLKEKKDQQFVLRVLGEIDQELKLRFVGNNLHWKEIMAGSFDEHFDKKYFVQLFFARIRNLPQFVLENREKINCHPVLVEEITEKIINCNYRLEATMKCLRFLGNEKTTSEVIHCVFKSLPSIDQILEAMRDTENMQIPEFVSCLETYVESKRKSYPQMHLLSDLARVVKKARI